MFSCEYCKFLKLFYGTTPAASSDQKQIKTKQKKYKTKLKENY